MEESVYDQKVIPQVMNQYCEQPHWNAHELYKKYTIPDDRVIGLPMPPRPYSRICLEYKTTAEFTKPPPVPEDMIFYGASSKYPPQRYIKNIDAESELERLYYPLSRDPLPKDAPEAKVYIPSEGGPLYTQRFLVPPARPTRNQMLAELEVPSVLLDMKGYGCREAELAFDQAANQKIWFNASRQEKYNATSGLGEERYDYPNGRPASAENLPRVHQ